MSRVYRYTEADQTGIMVPKLIFARVRQRGLVGGYWRVWMRSTDMLELAVDCGSSVCQHPIIIEEVLGPSGLAWRYEPNLEQDWLLQDTLLPAKPASLECPCGIPRSRCEYHG